MKTSVPPRAVRACLVLAALALALGLPARAAASGCPAQPTAQRFLAWSDPGWYAPLPDSGFERGGMWTLAGGSAVVAGNEPFFIGAAMDAYSLSMPTRASAVSAPMCLGIGHPVLRMLIRNQGVAAARLNVAAIITDPLGTGRTVTLASLPGTAQWAPSLPIPVLVDAGSALAPQQVSFRFAPADALGRWTIDDVYVDPYGKG